MESKKIPPKNTEKEMKKEEEKLQRPIIDPSDPISQLEELKNIEKTQITVNFT
jgi:hypothetical protein